MNTKLYLEGTSGISGDMFVGALLDLGADVEKLQHVIHSMNLVGFQIEMGRVQKNGLNAFDFSVVLDAAHENHDHDMNYLCNTKPEREDLVHHEHLSNLHAELHHHTVDEQHSKQEHKHEHRTLPDILKIISAADMTDHARELAIKIFTILGKAEAKAHGIPINQVHFHEVGAVDSIVDIVAAAVCFDDLGITETIVPSLYEGHGLIRCQHGMLPIPVPAVSNIIEENHLSIHRMPYEGEFITPTGAAIAAAICTGRALPEIYEIARSGIGAGKRNYEIPSILRAYLIRDISEKAEVTDQIGKLECNMDDITGENLGYIMDLLMEEGALDACFIPVFMKKNRPAYQLEVLCSMDQIDKIESMIFAESTTIGIRRQIMNRTILKREKEILHTKHGDIVVKTCILPSGERRSYPEYEEIKRLAQEKNKTFLESMIFVQNAINNPIQ